MRKLINWLFCYYKESPGLQGLALGIALVHIGIIAGWTTIWLLALLPWPTR